MRHLFTVDVEEHFHVHALEDAVPRREWSDHPSRVESSTARILEILDEVGASGTFFVLGRVAHRTPEVVRLIADAGHEVASHGMNHRRVHELKPEEFRHDVRDSRALLEDIAGTRVYGFRAPSFSLRDGCEWALDVLAEEGYRYDASRMPVRRPSLTPPSDPTDAHLVRTPSGPILEVPVTPVRRAGFTLPAGGGAYFRHLPYALTQAALRDAEARGRPGVFYVHPWELDPGQPKIEVPPITRLRHYGGLARTARRLRRLVEEFAFGSVRDVYRVRGESAPPPPSRRTPG